jgi:hypothetical protein
MNQIVDEGRRFASAADLQISDMSANSPVGTTLAILERTLKVMSAVQARIHYAMKLELKLLKDIIRDYTPEKYDYEPVEGSPRAKKSDYDQVDVIPVSDPNAATMAQKVVQYQAVMQMAQANPQIYDLVELNRQMLEVLGIKNIGKLVPNAEDQKPKDPVQENMAIINGKPVKAFIYQDHESHIAVHRAAMQDPKIMQIVGQNPKAQMIQAAAMAHINEHVAFQYRKEIEKQLGVPLPDMDKELPHELEVEISRMMALAAQKLLSKDQAETAQQQAQQTAQDPLVQMQQQELQLKAKEVDLKAQKIAMDAAAKADQIELEKARIDAQKEIAGVQAGARAAAEKAKLDGEMQIKGLEIGSAIAKDRAEMGLKGQQHNLNVHQALNPPKLKPTKKGD